MAEKAILNTAEIKFWQSEAQSCVERQRRELVDRNNYPFLVNYYEGIDRVDVAHPHVAAKQRMAIINEYFPNTNSLISDITYKNPDILLEATRPDSEESLPVMRSALEYLLLRSDALVENRVALFDMFYAGYCAVEVDQLPTNQGEKNENEEAPKEEEAQGVIGKVVKGIKDAMNPEEAERNFAKLSPPLETNFSTVQGTYIRRYDPIDVPLDWRARRIKDRRYNLKKVWMSKAEFDTAYPKFKDMVDVQDNTFEHSRHDSMMHNRRVLLYEFQARLRGNKYQTIIISPTVLTREIDTFVRPYTTNNFNMKIGSLHKYGKLYPRSFAQVNKTMQDEMNHYVRFMMEVAERNIPKYVTDKNKVKVDAKAALRSTKVNDIAEIDGNTTGAVTPVQSTHVSLENKEMLTIFQDQKNKLWSVSESRISGKATAKFATEIAIQEQSFQEKNIDVQEGLRLLMVEELGTGKDLIVTFWDGEVFLKVTGSEKMQWYEPIMVPDPSNPERQIAENPLTELLTADYFVNIDIASAGRPNRRQQLSNMFFFMNQLVQMRALLVEQGKDINLEEIKRVSKEFGWNPDKLFVDHQPATVPGVPTAGGENISPEEDAARQAQAEVQVEGGGAAQ